MVDERTMQPLKRSGSPLSISVKDMDLVFALQDRNIHAYLDFATNRHKIKCDSGLILVVTSVNLYCNLYCKHHGALTI